MCSNKLPTPSQYIRLDCAAATMAQPTTNTYDCPWPVHTYNIVGASSSTTTSISRKSSNCSDLSSTNPTETMNPPLPVGREDVQEVMAQVLVRMTRVVEHLRSKGEAEAANTIAKNIVDAVTVFNETTAPWDMESMLMQPVTTAISQPTSTVRNRPASASGPPASSNNSPSSWAAIAAVAPADGNSVVKFGASNTGGMSTVVARASVDSANPDTRVLWIRGWKEHRPLADVTRQVGQGPIYSMAYSPKDTSVCVIFQHARSVKALKDDDGQYTQLNGRSRFGEGCSVMIGLPFPEDDDILRMANPHNERRRLTFARQQLFANGMTETKFKADIYSIVGVSNVELVWLFNSGNATVVFSAVTLARMVRNEFMKLARQPSSPYRDVQITFSHDPCERPMSLIKQMPAGRDFREGTYGGESALPPGIITKSAPSSRRNARDSDGWQTVGRKR